MDRILLVSCMLVLLTAIQVKAEKGELLIAQETNYPGRSYYPPYNGEYPLFNLHASPYDHYDIGSYEYDQGEAHHEADHVDRNLINTYPQNPDRTDPRSQPGNRGYPYSQPSQPSISDRSGGGNRQPNNNNNQPRSASNYPTLKRPTAAQPVSAGRQTARQDNSQADRQWPPNTPRQNPRRKASAGGNIRGQLSPNTPNQSPSRQNPSPNTPNQSPSRQNPSHNRPNQYSNGPNPSLNRPNQYSNGPNPSLNRPNQLPNRPNPSANRPNQPSNRSNPSQNRPNEPANRANLTPNRPNQPYPNNRSNQLSPNNRYPNAPTSRNYPQNPRPDSQRPPNSVSSNFPSGPHHEAPRLRGDFPAPELHRSHPEEYHGPFTQPGDYSPAGYPAPYPYPHDPYYG